MSFSPDRPYDDLPDLPPTVDIESKAVLKACTETRVALAALRQATALIPNPAVLINSIPLLDRQRRKRCAIERLSKRGSIPSRNVH